MAGLYSSRSWTGPSNDLWASIWGTAFGPTSEYRSENENSPVFPKEHEAAETIPFGPDDQSVVSRLNLMTLSGPMERSVLEAASANMWIRYPPHRRDLSIISGIVISG